MLVELSKIHSSPHPIRQTWSEEKMQELAQSIRELGVIVPIKLRANEKGYEIVFGHRRVEAARRAGLTDIPALVEGLDDAETIMQAIIENELREDMVEIEKVQALQSAHEEWSVPIERIANLLGVTTTRVEAFLRLAKDQLIPYVNSKTSLDLHKMKSLTDKAQATRPLQDLEDRAKVLEVVGQRGYADVNAVAQAIRPLPKEDRQAVLNKAKDEGLNPDQIERVANTVQQARQEDNSLLKESALAIRGNAPAYQDMVEQRAGMMRYIERKEKESKRKKKTDVEDYDELVKEGINYIRMLDDWMTEYAYEGIEQGKFSPEAARFVLRRLDGLIEEYQRLRPVLEKVK